MEKTLCKNKRWARAARFWFFVSFRFDFTFISFEMRIKNRWCERRINDKTKWFNVIIISCIGSTVSTTNSAHRTERQQWVSKRGEAETLLCSLHTLYTLKFIHYIMSKHQFLVVQCACECVWVFEASVFIYITIIPWNMNKSIRLSFRITPVACDSQWH